MKATIVEKAVAPFLQSLRQRNSSIHTIKAYNGDLAEFSAYVGSRSWKEIDHVTIRQDATLGTAGVLLYGADIGEAAYVSPHSVVMKHEHLLAGQRYEGVPTAEQRP